MHATATAPANIALVKYWGKRDPALNLPAAGSISVTLGGLETTTSIRFDDDLEQDHVTLDGQVDAGTSVRVTRFLQYVRERFEQTSYAEVKTTNNFPTGAGLASSASGFAALTLAVDKALALGLAPEALSALARQGSGSAARSLIDGFAEMHPGTQADGEDAFATQLASVDALPLTVLAAITTSAPKAVSSSEGMERCRKTSPYHAAWLGQVGRDLDAMRTAIADGELERVGAIAERNALCMHADMLAAEPPLRYWNAATVTVLDHVAALRAEGAQAWCTIDAGPQVKVLCNTDAGSQIAKSLIALPGVEKVHVLRPSIGARVIEDPA
jgi:diphosphomevalonate decarboxylase